MRYDARKAGISPNCRLRDSKLEWRLILRTSVYIVEKGTEGGTQMGGTARTQEKRRVFVAATAVGALLACTSVKMVQREGCWVKQTSRTLGGTSEELGFCTKPPPEWAQDRLARLVQECMAQADYRWENRALASWSRNQPIPPPESDESIAKTCMSQASAALGLEAENGALKSRLADLNQDRDSLREVTDKDREYLQQSGDKMVTALGEAAKKPAPNATATATSTGTAKTESDLRSAQQPGQGAPLVIAPGTAMAPAAVAPAAPCMTRAGTPHRMAAGKKPACQPAPAEEKATTPEKTLPHPETVMR